MTTKQLTEFDHPAAWTAEGLLAPFFSKDDFPISNLAAMIEEHREELEFGLGIFNIVGFHDPRLPDQCRNGPAHR